MDRLEWMSGCGYGSKLLTSQMDEHRILSLNTTKSWSPLSLVFLFDFESFPISQHVTIRMEAMAVKAALAEVETPMVCPWANVSTCQVWIWHDLDYFVASVPEVFINMIWNLHSTSARQLSLWRSLGGDLPAKNTETLNVKLQLRKMEQRPYRVTCIASSLNFIILILVRNESASKTRC